MEHESSRDSFVTTNSEKAFEMLVASANKTRSAAKDIWAKSLVKTRVGRSKFATLNRKSSYFQVKQLNQSTSSQEEDEPIYNSMHELWSDDVYNLPVCKDLPRLVRRVCVVSQDDEILFLPPGSSTPARTKPRPPASQASDKSESSASSEMEPDTTDVVEHVNTTPRRSSRLERWSALRKRRSVADQSELNKNSAVIKLINDLVIVLTKAFESEETQESVANGLAEIRDRVTEKSDMQHVSREVIELLGKDSKVVKVLKCIHQNVVLHSTVELKSKLTMKYNTKDIRSSDGWRIVITLAQGYVQVCHTRREQSLDAFGDTSNHWEFEWEVRMTFDDSMTDMTAAQLRIAKLILSETMEESLATDLKATLVDGLIVM